VFLYIFIYGVAAHLLLADDAWMDGDDEDDAEDDGQHRGGHVVRDGTPAHLNEKGGGRQQSQSIGFPSSS